MLIRFIQRNQGHRDSVMHEFHSNVNKVNKAVAKVRTIGDRLPFTERFHFIFIHFVFNCLGMVAPQVEKTDLQGAIHYS